MSEPIARILTVDYRERVRVLPTVCGVLRRGCPLSDNMQIPEFDALWDTGAVASVISNKVVDALQLIPDGKTLVYHADGKSIVNTYTINLRLPNGVMFQDLRVSSGELKDTDVLIGMDIIAMGDFAVTAPGGRTKLSFQIPSTHDIDFSVR